LAFPVSRHDFFLRGLLKGVFKNEPLTVGDVKRSTTYEIAAIRNAVLAAKDRRVGLCLQAEGNQFQHFL
jgi:hypothetical protein